MARIFDDMFDLPFYELHTLNSYHLKTHLRTAIELICGKYFYDRSKVPEHPDIMVIDDPEFSDTAVSIYGAAIKAIKSRILRAEIKPFDSDFPQMVYREMPLVTQYTVKIGDFLKWAISNRLFLEENLQVALGIFQSKGRVRNRVLEQQAAAQFAWHIKRNQTVEELQENPVMKKYGPRQGYESIKNFRMIVKAVDPRPPEFKTKRRRDSLSFPPFPPKYPKDLIRESSHKKKLRDFFKVEVICKVILEELKIAFPELHSRELSEHPLIRLYFDGSPPFLEKVLEDWISDV